VRSAEGRYESTKVRKYESTKVRKYESTKVRKYESTKVRKGWTPVTCRSDRPRASARPPRTMWRRPVHAGGLRAVPAANSFALDGRTCRRAAAWRRRRICRAATPRIARKPRPRFVRGCRPRSWTRQRPRVGAFRCGAADSSAQAASGGSRSPVLIEIRRRSTADCCRFAGRAAAPLLAPGLRMQSAQADFAPLLPRLQPPVPSRFCSRTAPCICETFDDDPCGSRGAGPREPARAGPRPVLPQPCRAPAIRHPCT
jgi:hypothetical protein